MFTRPFFVNSPLAKPGIHCKLRKKPVAFTTLCALCDVEFNNRHLCPACLETGKTKHKIKNLENHRVCYDKVALYIALISMIFVWLTLITAPIVVFMVIRYWSAPGSIIAHTKIRFVLALTIACLQIAAWILFFGILMAT